MDMDNLTNRWLATLGIGAVIFGLALFVLRVPVLYYADFLCNWNTCSFPMAIC